jgi:hypothetical protein
MVKLNTVLCSSNYQTSRLWKAHFDIIRNRRITNSILLQHNFPNSLITTVGDIEISAFVDCDLGRPVKACF